MTLESRMAVEALRAGVPNRAAIRQMGTEQTIIEAAFVAALEGAWTDADPVRAGAGAHGIGMAGGFGTGKSHMLGYLAEVARQRNFVVSRVVISKETPLSHPAHIVAAALANASLPDRPDDTIAACLNVLREKPEALDALEAAVSATGSGFAGGFAACLYLLRRSTTSADMMRQIGRFWSGAKFEAAVFRKALAEAGAGKTFSLRAAPAAEATEQLTRFVPLLFRAVGYAGWCILLDEVELIGRYAPSQRAWAYVWLAAWIGLDPARRYPGVVSAYAITDDFVTAVINARADAERLPERLKQKGRMQDAEMAVTGMRHIERTVLGHRLLPPTPDDLVLCHDKVRRLYAAAYDWEAPTLPPAERTSSRTMRQYIKGWVTQWDMLRLGGGAVSVVDEGIAANYAEDASLAEPAALDEEEEA
jgi:hypothetical protein